MSTQRRTMVAGLTAFLVGVAFAALVLYGKLQQDYVRHAQRPLDAALFQAVDQDDVARVRLLLKSGAAVDARRFSLPQTIWEPLLRADTRLRDPSYPLQIGYTPLMIACMGGDPKLVKVLLDAGANTETIEREREDRTPLVLAIHYDHPAVVSILLQHGANPNGIPGTFGPVYAAWVNSDTSTSALLLSHGAKPLPTAMKKRVVPLK